MMGDRMALCLLALAAAGTVAGVFFSGAMIMVSGSVVGVILAGIFAEAHRRGPPEHEPLVGAVSLAAAAVFGPMLLTAAVTGIEWSALASSMIGTIMRGTLFPMPTLYP